ncbi:MAG: arsenate reductase (glutaredoxin) [Alphaproteobacteria bacterium]|nr:arsenate reductase (glutaredoxin) [Alphaproteobacteria bacterium]
MAGKAVTLLHNPRCGKSRQALALLRERGIEPAIVEYLKTPLDAASLKRLLAQLGMTARQLLRKGEPAYKERGLADPKLTDAALIAAMAAEPILIERPIALAGARAVVGRPPERVLEVV